MIKQDLGLEALGMAAHPLHQFRSLDAVRIAGPVIDIGRGHQLPALFQSGNQDRLEVGARGINRGRVAGGSGAEDQQPAVFGFAHRLDTPGRPIRIGDRVAPSLARNSQASGAQQ
jgi:hypothetical protein